MLRTGLLVGSTALILLLACTPTNDTIPEAQPQSSWERVDIPGWLTQPGFTIQLPDGWLFRESQGIDSYVGEFVGDDMVLFLDYGGLAGGANPLDYPQDRYVLEYESFSGEEAILILSKDETTGEQLIMSIPRLRQGPSLNIYGTGLNPKQIETAVAIFRSVSGLTSVLKLQIIFYPDGPLIASGGPTPNVVVEILNPQGKTQVRERQLKGERLNDGGRDLDRISQYEFWLDPGTYDIDIHFLEILENIVVGDFPKRFIIDTDETVEEEIEVYLATTVPTASFTDKELSRACIIFEEAAVAPILTGDQVREISFNQGFTDPPDPSLGLEIQVRFGIAHKRDGCGSLDLIWHGGPAWVVRIKGVRVPAYGGIEEMCFEETGTRILVVDDIEGATVSGLGSLTTEKIPCE